MQSTRKTIAPTIDSTQPGHMALGLKGSSRVAGAPKRKWPIRPPTTAPRTPRQIVRRMLMLCRPGTNRRARAPMTKPATTQLRMFHNMFDLSAKGNPG